MVWPFTSNKGKETSELVKELPEDLKDFYHQSNPEGKYGPLFEPSVRDEKVNRVLQEHANNRETSYDFDRYKRRETARVATQVNCAEVQHKVIECIRNWKLMDASHCSHEVKNFNSCVEIQKKAFGMLYYDDCYSIEQCSKIRFVVDKLFTENFGRYAESIGNANTTKFFDDVNNVFDMVWK